MKYTVEKTHRSLVCGQKSTWTYNRRGKKLHILNSISQLFLRNFFLNFKSTVVSNQQGLMSSSEKKKWDNISLCCLAISNKWCVHGTHRPGCLFLTAFINHWLVCWFWMVGWNQETSSNIFLQLLVNRSYFKRLSMTGQRERNKEFHSWKNLTRLQSKSYERYMNTYFYSLCLN